MPPLVLTMGEPAGIGGEIALQAWLHRRHEAVPAFAVIADPRHLQTLARHLGLSVRCISIADISEAPAVWTDGLPILTERLAGEVTPGQPDPRHAGAVIRSIERAVALVMAGDAAAMVTNPINKHVLHAAGFEHPGHTEFLGVLAGVGAVPVMMLAGPSLRVVPVTVHVGLRRALDLLDTAGIVAAGRVTAAALSRDFGIAAPRIAVAGLNPHAGEGGMFGREEIDVIGPAIDILRGEGVHVIGPLPPDTMFHAAARATYDAALCMYHDQALIPLKTLDFDRGVNITLGLPFVRTSPDHGTAFDIAGTGAANAASLIEALKRASEMAAMRQCRAA